MDGLRLVEEARSPPRWHWSSGWGSLAAIVCMPGSTSGDTRGCSSELLWVEVSRRSTSSCVPQLVVCFKYRTAFTSLTVHFPWSEIQFLQICVPGNFGGNPKVEEPRSIVTEPDMTRKMCSSDVVSIVSVFRRQYCTNAKVPLYNRALSSVAPMAVRPLSLSLLYCKGSEFAPRKHSKGRMPPHCNTIQIQCVV